jgi:hypothetical protein
MSLTFNDKQNQPTNELVSTIMGESKGLLDELINYIETQFGECTPEWKFYGTKIGWSLKLLNKKRNLIFIGPEEGYFRAAFAFGEKACQAILASEMPETIKDELRTAKVYVEGRPLRLTVKTPTELTLLKQLVDIKVNN